MSWVEAMPFLAAATFFISVGWYLGVKAGELMCDRWLPAPAPKLTAARSWRAQSDTPSRSRPSEDGEGWVLD